MKTKLEIINETAEFYSADPVGRRAVKQGLCEYCTQNGRHCAVGRVALDPEALEGNFRGETVIAFCDDAGSIDHCLKEEYHGHGSDFWRDLQAFHDNHEYWEPYGLSFEGKRKLGELQAKYQS